MRNRFSKTIFFTLRVITILIFIAKSSFANDFEDFKLIGKSDLSFLGFKIYDIELSGESNVFSYNQKLALKIDYDKDFEKEDLIQTSIDEIVRINQLDQKNTEKLYRSSFEKIFVDVKKGDKKIAIYDPNFGIKLFYNGRLIGKVKDKVFAKRFFDIWLNKNAKFKNLRNKLINLDE